MSTGFPVWVSSPVPESPDQIPKQKEGKKMFMDPNRIQELSRADDATVTLCYHGITMIHNCDAPGSGKIPVFALRYVGHLVNGDFNPEDLRTEEKAPEHREFTIDIPMSPELLREMATELTNLSAQADACELLQSPPMNPDEWPEFLRALFADKDDEGDDD